MKVIILGSLLVAVCAGCAAGPVAAPGTPREDVCGTVRRDGSCLRATAIEVPAAPAAPQPRPLSRSELLRNRM